MTTPLKRSPLTPGSADPGCWTEKYNSKVLPTGMEPSPNKQVKILKIIFIYVPFRKRFIIVIQGEKLKSGGEGDKGLLTARLLKKVRTRNYLKVQWDPGKKST